ncbi:MAG: ABC transporter permease [Bacteroidota bacterium]|nr:ABC transporter permease [Bacteroidota bacterium]
MNVLLLIIKREFINKIKNKSFIVMTFLSPLLVVAMGVLISYLATINQGDTKKVAVLDEFGFFEAGDLNNDDKYIFHKLEGLDKQKAKVIVADSSYEALIYVPKVADRNNLATQIEYISDNSPKIEFIYKIENIISDKLTKYNIQSKGIDYNVVSQSKVKASMNLTKFSGADSVRGLNEIKIGIGSVFGYMIMMFIVIYGNFVMRSVIEEKTNRIIEIIVSSVKPFQLMMGKIIGTSLAGILQFLIWGVVGTVLFFVLSGILGIELGGTHDLVKNAEVNQIVAQQSDIAQTVQTYINELYTLPIITLLISFVLYFIGGYFLYSSIYAAIGAAVDNETDSQQFLMPIIMPLVLGVYIGFFTVIDDPHGSVSTIFSIIPFTSPIVMLMRIPFGVPLWQILLSLVLLFLTFFLIVWVAAKIYRVGILMYGKKPTWKEMYKWIKY